jgi:hypothetical protein
LRVSASSKVRNSFTLSSDVAPSENYSLICNRALRTAPAHRKPAGAFLGQRFAEKILAVGQGKISSPDLFVTARLFEAGWLIALLLLLAFVLLAAKKIFQSKKSGWVPLAICAFVGANLWIFGALRTGLAWAALTTRGANSNFTQFAFKKQLLDEHRAPRRAILLGSSQTQAQLDENILNQQLAGKIWTTELHFPGSHALDLLLVLRRLRAEPADTLVCYLSEYYFYAGANSTTAPYFFHAEDISLLKELGWGEELITQPFTMGLLAQTVPAFACREPLAFKLLGSAINSLDQSRHDAALDTNLTVRAESSAAAFALDANAARQKMTFVEFVKEAARQNRRVILLEGQVNPILAEKIPAAMRDDMRQFLRQLAAANPHVTLIPEGDLPPQPPATYQDLTHVTKEAQKQFSTWFATRLESM